jgi:ABC-type transporter Mla subunit MlaD
VRTGPTLGGEVYGGAMRLPSVPGLPGPHDVLALLGRAGDAVELLLAAVPRVGSLLDEVERLLGDVDALIERIEGTRRSADALIERTGGTVGQIVTLTESLEPSLTRLQPTIERLAETTDPHEVDALVGLIDHLPLLLEQVERDILPILGSLGSVAPDLHDLLDVSRELNEMLAKLPGMGRIKKRVDEQQALEKLDGES